MGSGFHLVKQRLTYFRATATATGTILLRVVHFSDSCYIRLK